jgi:hypothetical protein
MRLALMTRPVSLLPLAGALVVLLLVACGNQHDAAQPAVPPPDPARATLGAHTLVGQEDGSAAAVARALPLATADSGSSFIAFSAGYASNTSTPSDNKDNQWLHYGDPVVYAGYGGRFDVKAYLVQGGQGGTNHLVSIEKPGEPAGELTMPVVEIRNGARLVDVAQNYAPTGTRLASGSVTTDGPALLVAFWWGDGGGLHHTAVPDNGFTVIEQFTDLPPGSAVQCVVAAREVAAAGNYSVTWSTTPAQGAPLWVFAFAPPR